MKKLNISHKVYRHDIVGHQGLSNSLYFAENNKILKLWILTRGISVAGHSSLVCCYFICTLFCWGLCLHNCHQLSWPSLKQSGPPQSRGPACVPGLYVPLCRPTLPSRSQEEEGIFVSEQSDACHLLISDDKVIIIANKDTKAWIK